jgi:multiple sugar transport system substrate-binding protein
MKRTLKVSAILLLALLLVAGCSSANNNAGSGGNHASDSGSSSTGKTTIRLLSSDDFAGFREKAIAEFNAQNPDIEIVMEHVSYDQLHDKEWVSFNASGDSAYDIIDVDEIWTAEMANAGFIIPVTDRYTDEMKSGILQSGLTIATYNGELYGVPMFNDVLFFYYNEEMLQQAGYDHPPATWDEFTEMSLTLQERGITDGAASSWGFSANEGLVAYFASFLGSHGGSFFDENGNPTFNDEKGVRALQFMVDSLNNGVMDKASINYTDRQILDAFKSGKTAFVSGWSFYWGELTADDSPVKGKVKVGLLPAVEGAPHATGTGSMYLAITQQSQNPDAAWKVIEFLGSKEQQKKQSIDAGSLPIWEELYGDEELNANHGALPDMVKQLEQTISRPSLDGYMEFSKDLQVAIQAALMGQKTPQQALDEIAQKADQYK